jgi:hypothetical protein
VETRFAERTTPFYPRKLAVTSPTTRNSSVHIVRLRTEDHGVCFCLNNRRSLLLYFLSRIGPYIDEVTWDHQCGFRQNRIITEQIFFIYQIVEKKLEYNGTVHQLDSKRFHRWCMALRITGFMDFLEDVQIPI